jgi:hypothetical protein
MRMFTAVAFGVVAVLSATTAAAQETCRSRAGAFPLGAVVCLEIPCVGKRMARCDRVLNNTSWTFLDQPCPVASRPTPEKAPGKVAKAHVIRG